MVNNDKALNFGVCRGQKAALVREEGITDAKQMRVFTRLSVTADKKSQVYALVRLKMMVSFVQNCDIARSYDLVSVRPLTQDTFEMACDNVCL